MFIIWESVSSFSSTRGLIPDVSSLVSCLSYLMREWDISLSVCLPLFPRASAHPMPRLLFPTKIVRLSFRCMYSRVRQDFRVSSVFRDDDDDRESRQISQTVTHTHTHKSNRGITFIPLRKSFGSPRLAEETKQEMKRTGKRTRETSHPTLVFPHPVIPSISASLPFLPPPTLAACYFRLWDTNMYTCTPRLPGARIFGLSCADRRRARLSVVGMRRRG